MNDIPRSFWTLPPQRSLPETIAERIVEAIGSGALKPGERIVELRLAADLGVSRGPLREALKALEARGLVDSQRGRGTVVAQNTDADLLAMVMLRANLEGFAARFVTTRMSEVLAARLTALLAEGRAAAEEGRTSDWRDLDWEFHESVVAGAENPFLLSAWRGIGDLVRLFLHTHPVFVREVGATLGNHETLFAALRSGDPDRAETEFRRVILGSAFRRFGQALPAALTCPDPTPPPVEASRPRSGRRTPPPRRRTSALVATSR